MQDVFSKINSTKLLHHFILMKNGAKRQLYRKPHNSNMVNN